MPTVHEYYEQLIPDYLLGTIDAAAASGLEQHLVSCASCRARLNELKPVFVMLGNQPAPEPPTHYFNTILPRVRERLQRKQPVLSFIPPGFGRVVAPLAALGLAIALLVHVPLTGLDDGSAGLKELVGSLKSDDLVDVLAAQTGPATISQGSAAEAVAAAFTEKEIARQIARTILDERNVAEAVFPHTLADIDEQELELILRKLGERTLL